MNDYHYEDDDPQFDEADGDGYENDLGDCAMGPDGQCGKAGSEECDWECPIMAGIIRRESQKKVKKK